MAPDVKLSNLFAHCQEYCHRYVTTCLLGRMTGDMVSARETTIVDESQPVQKGAPVLMRRTAMPIRSMQMLSSAALFLVMEIACGISAGFAQPQKQCTESIAENKEGLPVTEAHYGPVMST